MHIYLTITQTEIISHKKQSTKEIHMKIVNQLDCSLTTVV